MSQLYSEEISMICQQDSAFFQHPAHTLRQFSKSIAIGVLSLFLLTSVLTSTAHAEPKLPELASQSDVDKILRELSANTSYHSVTPPSSMGSLFGFELGFVGGITNTPDTNTYVEQASGASMKMFPHASLLGAVTVPFGITVEALYVPKIATTGVNYDSLGAALKWTPTDGIFILPLNIALRGFYSSTTISFSQSIQNSSTSNIPVDATIKYSGSVTGLQILASPKLIPIIEPYAGIGLLTAKGKFDVSGSGTVTIFPFSASQSAESNNSSTQILAGVDIRLLLIGFGVEYERAFGTDSITAKMSLKF